MLRYIAAILFVFGLVAPVAANPDFDLGPPTGSKAPTIGTPLDESGKPRSMESLMGDKGLVLFFFRSAAWCPFCQAQLMDLNSGVGEIEKRGYRLAGSHTSRRPSMRLSLKSGVSNTRCSAIQSQKSSTATICATHNIRRATAHTASRGRSYSSSTGTA